jgi:hypothetical protein
MEISDLARMTNYTIRDERMFVYEVVIPSPAGEYNPHSLYRRSKILLRVNYSQMSSVMRRIASLGGKILSITPVRFSKAEVTPVAPISQLPWWVEILTTQPPCLYYFGPFDSTEEAIFYQTGYIEDLLAEGSQGISIQVKQCQPEILTQEW